LARFVFRTLAAVPNRMGRGGSFTAAAFVTTKATSPQPAHSEDGRRGFTSASRRTTTSGSRDAKDKLKEAFAAAKVAGRGFEVYKRPASAGACRHGRRRPTRRSQQARSREGVGEAFVALYKAALA